MNRPIGVFDSGIGGLTVMKELMNHLPGEDIIYFGDTARVPYGTKSKETIVRFSIENVLFLLQFNVKLIVVACNTSTSLALDVLKRNFKIPIIGVIRPSVQVASEWTRSKRIGVIGTSATIASGAYQREIKNVNPQIRVFSQSCPLFVPLVEEGWINEKITRQIVEKYLTPLKRAKVDALILGCTHYPLLKRAIQNFMGKDVRLIDSARQVSLQAKDMLLGEAIVTNKKKGGKYEFYVSDETGKFSDLSKRFIGTAITNVKKAKGI